MQPLFSKSCSKQCAHPAIQAAKLCKKAMGLANEQHLGAAEKELKTALLTLRKAELPMMKAKILNSLGILYMQQKEMGRATRCFNRSLTIVAKQIGTENWFYGKIAENRQQAQA